MSLLGILMNQAPLTRAYVEWPTRLEGLLVLPGRASIAYESLMPVGLSGLA